MVDCNRRITYWNKAAERITGYYKNEMEGSFCSNNILQHIDEREIPLCREQCLLHQTLSDGQVREGNLYLHHKQGHRVLVSIQVFPLRDRLGQITGAAELFTDQVEYHKNQSINYQILLNRLMGLENHRFGEMILQSRLYELQTFNVPFGVLFIDVDRFQTINDTYGLEIGDQVLHIAGKTLLNLTRQTDTALRWGGDEFLLVLPHLTIFLLQEIAERIRAIVSQSFLVHCHQKISVTVSIGATMAVVGDSVDSLISRAVQEMRHSKDMGRNKVSVSD